MVWQQAGSRQWQLLAACVLSIVMRSANEGASKAQAECLSKHTVHWHGSFGASFPPEDATLYLAACQRGSELLAAAWPDHP